MSTEPLGSTKSVTVRDFAAASDKPTILSSSPTSLTPEGPSCGPPGSLRSESARGQQPKGARKATEPSSESPAVEVGRAPGSAPKSEGKDRDPMREDSKYAWPKTYESRYCLNAIPTTFERRYPRDRPGTEIEDGARVWRLYRDRASKQDNDLFEAWKEILDVLLVFAGLFSAVCTAFIIESTKLLQPDWTEISARAAYASWAASSNASVSPVKEPQHPDEYVPPAFAQWANWLWFISLSLALIVALLAILAKQWIGQYRLRMRAQVPSHRIWVWRHRAFGDGLHKYKLETVIATLPPMLHLSLFVFFAGLYTFLQPFSPRLALVIGVGVLALLGVYVILSVLLPLRYGDCPMSTPLIEHLQYWLVSVYRATMRWAEWRLPRIGDWTRTDKPAPDMTAFHEERLFRSSTIPRRNTRALWWMVNHFRDCNEVSVALEAVGALSVPEHRDHFDPGEIRALRDMTIWRAHTLDVQSGSDVSNAERVGMLRTSLFLASIGTDDDKDILRDVHADSHYDTIETHDAPFLYQALVQRENNMLETLNELERWLLAGTRPDLELPVTAVSLALWTAPAVEYLLSDAEVNGQAIGPRLNLNQLAMLLICIVHSSSAADALGNSQSPGRASDSLQQWTARADARTRYEAGHARQIAQRALRLIPVAQRNQLLRTVTADGTYQTEHEHDNDPWIVQSLLFWGSILEDKSTLGDQAEQVDGRTIRAVYTVLLTHISARTLPIDKEANLNRTLSALKYLNTPQFAEGTWGAAALLGPLDLLERAANQLTTTNTYHDAWQTASTLIAHLFAYVAKHGGLVRRDALAQRMSHIIDVMGKHRTPWRPFSIGDSLIVHSLSHGQNALLRIPPTEGLASIWHSACRLRAAGPIFYNAKMFTTATAIAHNLSVAVSRSQEQRNQIEELLKQLLEPDSALTMLQEPEGRMLNLHVRKMSAIVYEEAQKRLDRLTVPGGQNSKIETVGGVAAVSSSSIRKYEIDRAGPKDHGGEVHTAAQTPTDLEAGLSRKQPDRASS